MIFEGKPAEHITPDELQQVVTDRVSEDRHLDFKQEPYPSTKHGTRELVKDIVAFLNTDGGYLVLGIKEDGNGRAERFIGVEDPEAVRRSILDRCLDRIDPRPPRLSVAIGNVDGADIVVVHVPESDQKPHCARPDAEHHFFWRRYEDGNKLMTMAEIRECLEGDRVERRLTELHMDISALRHAQRRADEMSRPVSGQELFTLSSDEAFFHHLEQRLVAEVGDRPCYRLLACPIPVNDLDLRDHISELYELADSPPVLRPHGWELKPYAEARATELGVEAVQSQCDQLRVFRNGCVEYRVAADSESFHWAETGDPKPVNPFAIIEPAATLPLLVQKVCSVAGYQGQTQFRLALLNIEGMYLLPYRPQSFGYSRAKYSIGTPYGPKPFPDKHLRIPPVNTSAEALPGQVAWRLVSHVYHRFGYMKEQEVPFFDDEHKCTLGGRGDGGPDGGQ